MKTKTHPRVRHHGLVFWLGAVVFAVGISGAAWYFWAARSANLDRIFPIDTIVFAEISVDSGSLQKLKEVFPEADLQMVLDEVLERYLPQGVVQQFPGWIGSRAGVAMLPESEFLLAVQYRSRLKAEKFLQNFVLPTEGFDVERIKDAEVWIPKFSSQAAFAFHRGWLLLSTPKKALIDTLVSEQKLADAKKFIRIRSDLPRQTLAMAFIDVERAVNLFFRSERFISRKPLLEATAGTLPAAGITVQAHEKGIELYAKILTEEGVFSEQKIHKEPNEIMPELAQFSPRDSLFFMNGSDLYAKYLHTKNFLESFHPQFSVIFDGILRASSRRVFGEKFDFEQDFLAKMRGQYAVILDFEDGAYPFVHFTLITGFGGVDSEQSLSELHEAVRFAQGRFATKLQKVDLPDGTVREELVATEPEEIPIRKVELKSREYFTVENPSSSAKFSYGFLENYLVFSTHELGVRGVFTSHASPEGSLAQNEDFRESVLFGYSPSESYGFINIGKLGLVLEFITGVSTDELDPDTGRDKFSFGDFLRSSIRTATFARKVFPREIFWTATLFSR